MNSEGLNKLGKAVEKTEKEIFKSISPILDFVLKRPVLFTFLWIICIINISTSFVMTFR